MLAASHAAPPPPVSHGEYADRKYRQTDGQTDGPQTVTSRFLLDAPSVIKTDECKQSSRAKSTASSFQSSVVYAAFVCL